MKKMLLILSITAALALPLTAFAVSSNTTIGANIRSFCGIGIDASKLTEQQKTDLSASFDKMIELRKETINKMVANGTITSEQGKLALARIDEMSKNGGWMGSQMMNGLGNGNGRVNSRMMGGDDGRYNYPMMNGSGRIGARMMDNDDGNWMMNWNN